MAQQNDKARRQKFVEEFSAHQPRSDAGAVVDSLCTGLTTLQNLLFTRVHEDVERNVGQDSMVIPYSVLKILTKTRLEIDVYQIAVSAVEAGSRQYVSDRAWYVDWLRRLRLESEPDAELVARHLAQYLELSAENRRSAFSRVLEKTFPEATHAPLVLYRLFPLGAGIVTAIAFGDAAAATELREQQISWLPSIGDCQACHGKVLKNGEQCSKCGNPLWNYSWLNDTT